MIKTITTISAIANLLVLGIMAWLFFVPVEVLTLPRFSEVQLTTGYTYKPGDGVQFKAAFCKLTDHPTTIIRQLINGQVIPLLEYTSNIGQGCYNSESAKIILPDYVEEGPHRIRSTYLYKVNPIRTETYVHETEEFLICRDC